MFESRRAHHQSLSAGRTVNLSDRYSGSALTLDGRRTWERLTEFNRFAGYKASNPVVSDDGRYMAFQMARSRDPAGVGYGIFLYDFARAGQRR